METHSAAHNDLLPATEAAGQVSLTDQSTQRPSVNEVLVVDDRAHLRPSQMVERKLLSTLTRSAVLVSHVRSAAVGGGRRHL
jgi:hypothetical protein